MYDLQVNLLTRNSGVVVLAVMFWYNFCFCIIFSLQQQNQRQQTRRRGSVAEDHLFTFASVTKQSVSK